MKVCHVITGLGDGGAEAALYRLCTFQSDGGAANHQVVISLAGPGRYAPLLQAAGVEVHCLDMPRGRLTVSGLVRLRRLLRRINPDVVQTWMYHANLVGGVMARLGGIRHVVWGLHQTSLEPRWSSRATRLVNWACARLAGVVPSAIISCSQRGAAAHVALGYTASKMRFVPNGYDLSRFTPDATQRQVVRSALGAPSETFLFGIVARWHPMKDHRNLLRSLVALKSLQPTGWRCVLVGSGMDETNVDLMGLLDEYQLGGHAVPLGPSNDVAGVMNALDVHVLSSLSEAFPNVVAEAMACGTPCVVTDVGDAAFMVSDTGWTVPPDAPHALADALLASIRAAGDQVQWDRRQHACRSRVVELFSLQRMARDYRRVWLTAVEAGH